MTETIKGVLEIDIQRGVIYFHSNKEGITKLRICGLEIPLGWHQIDIANPQIVSYGKSMELKK